MAEQSDWQDGALKVVVNHEEQYSIWPADRDVPLGCALARRGDRCRPALDSAWLVYEDDMPPCGNQVLPDIVEAAVRCGGRTSAGAALDRLSERPSVSGTPWALGRWRACSR